MKEDEMRPAAGHRLPIRNAPRTEISWDALAAQVGALAATLERLAGPYELATGEVDFFDGAAVNGTLALLTDVCGVA
jgi:hypothetical protein